MSTRPERARKPAKRQASKMPLSFKPAADRTVTLRCRGNDSNLLIVFYVQIMPDDFVMQLHRF
ncbi:LysR family transcriptional regulator [Shigella dysenteriae]|uniref:LysR family transcriptional regulator n=1 Tax=Shigella dysenteriae TaxID=622 RepID=A0A2S8D9G9_SHIDY|nr:LysR family transcriptional regulator [Shigella dysenteriae]PQN95584.1 LysR family transcriptional regulator [Shigella dysenteriae]